MMNNKPKPNLSTNEPITAIRLEELFDLENLQRMQDLFAEAHNVSSIITYPDGTPITQPSQFSRFCTIIRTTEKGCANCFKSDALLGRHHPSGPVVQPCLSGGLWDAGSSITVNGQHVASWLIGQVRHDGFDEQQMLNYADEIGADKDEFMEAFFQVPVMSVDQFNKVAKMLFTFANELSEKGYLNLQLKRQMAERDRATDLLRGSEERFRTLFDKAPLGYQSLDIDGCFIEVNQQWLNLLGYSREEVIGKWFGNFLSPAYQDGFRKRFPIFKAQGHIHSEFEMVHKNGQLLFISFEGKIGYEQNGDFKQTHCILQDITERKKIEEELIASERSYRMLFESINDAIFISELTDEGKTKFIRVNNVACKRLGYTQDELLSKTSYEITSDRMKPTISGLIHTIIEKQNAIIESEHVTKDGQIIPVEISTRIATINNRTYFHSIARDITQRKQIEEALIKSEKYLNDSQKIAHLGSYSWDMVTGLWSSSKIMDEIFGIDQNYVRTLEGWTNIIHPDWQAPMTEYVINTVIGQHQPFDKEYKIIRQNDGQERWVHGRGELYFDSNNQPIALVGTISDITTRKLTEIKLQESEAKLSALFRSMTEMVVLHEMIFNDQGEAINYRITDCNQAFTEITGITKEEAVGKLATEIYHTEDAPYLEEFSRVTISGNPYEYTTYFAPMDKHFMISVVSPGKNQFATISTDITEMKQVSDMISAKNKELENYLYIASHDLRSPLVNIQGFSQRLQKQADTIRTLLAGCEMEIAVRSGIDKITNIDIPKTLHFIFSNVTKMDTLINALLQISRTGQMMMNIQQVDMNKLFQTILLTYNYQLTELSAKVIVKELPHCYGDENQLNQLFSNIIGNAIKYSDPNRQLILEITSSNHYNKVIYCIKDTGIGIAARHLERIWEVFFQVDAIDSKGGEGIGLSLAKRIVEKHKGKIWADSEQGKGSAFYIELQQHEFTE